MSSFAVVIHQEASGGYWGEVPALPGCYSQGETFEDLLANIREAIAGTLEVFGISEEDVTVAAAKLRRARAKKEARRHAHK
jgi:predicted RNase H-like HicB family nuclease